MTDFPYPLLEEVDQLSSYRGWTREVYTDFLAVQGGELSQQEFRDKYQWQRAVVSMDMTGFTSSTMVHGELDSLLRIVDAQKVCLPILHDFNAELIRCFADDIVALFKDPHAALDAAFEVHQRIAHFNRSSLASEHPTECCIGIGFGPVLAIGPNLAQGDEMNKSSKLGEDIARARETLLTENAWQALAERDDVQFELQGGDDQVFRFYRADKK